MTTLDRPDLSSIPFAQSDAPPASQAEVWRNAWDAVGLGGRLLTGIRREEAAYDADIDAIAKATGQRLLNPLRIDMTEMTRRLSTASNTDDLEIARRDTTHAGYMDRKRQLAEQFPQHAAVIRPDYSPVAEAGRQQAEAEQRLALSLEGSSLAVNLPIVGRVDPASLAQGFVTTATDPFVLVTAPLAGIRTGVGAAQVAWQGVKMAGANAAGAALEAPFVAAWRKRAGLDYTLDDFKQELLGAAAFGFAADVGIRSFARGVRRGLGHEPVTDATGNVTGWKRPDPKADPIGALDAAARAEPADSALRKAAAGDPDALRAVAREAGIADEPAMRGALDAMEADRMLDDMPFDLPRAEHQTHVADALRHVADPDLAPPPGDALPPVSGPEAAPERVAAMLARDPVDLAAEIRERPELLAENVPWSDHRLRHAAMLSRLSDTAFDRVAVGELRPEVAAIVAEHVADPGRHAALAAKLQALDPRSPAEARARLADLMQGPRDAATHRALAGDPMPAREAILHKVDDPYGADAGKQLEQLRARYADDIAKATGEKATGEAPQPEAGGKNGGEAKASKPEPIPEADVEHIVATWEYMREQQRKPKPQRLSDFLRKHGGIQEQRGEIARLVGSRKPHGALVRRNGMTLDDAAVFAWQHGFFDTPERPTINEFIDVLGDDLAGNRRVRIADEAAMEDHRIAAEMQADLWRLGVDNAKSSDEVRAILRADPDAAAQLAEWRGPANEGSGRAQGDQAHSSAAFDDLTDIPFAVRDQAGLKADLLRRVEIGDYSEADLAKLQGIVEGEIASVVDRLPKSVKADVIFTPDGIEGGFEPARRSIFVSLFALDPKAIATHEEIHALRPLFTDREWQLLVERAQKDGVRQIPFLEGKRTIDEVYPEKYGDRFLRPDGTLDAAALERTMNEEAVAYMRQRRVSGQDYGHAVNSVFARIEQFLERVRNALRGLGFQTADDVMRAIDRGDVAQREVVHAVKSLPGSHFPDGTLFAVRTDEKTGKRYIEAFHGSPHDFDSFSMDKIGTGEGAQAFGHGLYFADSEGVAKGYRDDLSSRARVGSASLDGAKAAVADAVGAKGRIYIDEIDGASGRRWQVSEETVPASVFRKSQKRSIGFIDELARPDGTALFWPHSNIPGALEKLQNPGRLYQVRINADPEHFLDWDKPLSQQSEVVKTAASEAWGIPVDKLHDDLFARKVPPGVSEKLRDRGVPGIKYLDGQSRGVGDGSRNYVIFDDKLIEITHKDGTPVSAEERASVTAGLNPDTGTMFALRGEPDYLKADLAEAAAMADARAKANRERQALLDHATREKNNGFVTTLRDARGQVDPAKAMRYLLEYHGEVRLPDGMTSVVAEAKAVEGLLKARLEEMMHEFRSKFLTGAPRARARLENVVREAAGEDTGDAAAKSFAQKWMSVAEEARQMFNGAGGDIPRLEGWFLPQSHDRLALLNAGFERWFPFIFERLDWSRIRREDGSAVPQAERRDVLRTIYENNTSDGHGTLAANVADPFGGIPTEFTGKGKLGNRRQEHRFLHFKSADAWLEYQAEFGGGADPFGAMMQHLTGISKDIAAMRVLGTNPERELQRLAQYVTKQAAMARPAAVLIDEAVRNVKDITAELLAQPSRMDTVHERIGQIHKDLDALRPRRGVPGPATQAKMQLLRDELMRLEKERGRILDNGASKVTGIAEAEIRQRLDDAYAELAAVQDADRQLFPRVTEFLGREMRHTGWWTKSPDDYARRQIRMAENMWMQFTGAASAPVDARFADNMQSLRNVGVISRGGSMVISSIADNFTQVMARRFAGVSTGNGVGTFRDIISHLGTLDRREAARQGLIAETYLHMFNDGARQGQGVTGHAWTAHLAERTIAWQGLGRLTDAQRMGFGMSLQAAFADMAHLSLAAIEKENAGLGRVLRRYGIADADWDAIRLGPDGKPVQVDFLSPVSVADRMEVAGRGDERVAERYLGMILQETDFASPTTMLRAKALLQGGTRPGTLIGELVRIGGQFKSFAVMFSMLHHERMLREFVAEGAWKGASYAAQVALVMTLGGAVVVALKDQKAGKDQQPLDDPKFWGRAVLQGGGIGIVGDLIQSETNRFGGGLVSTVAGPVVGLAEDAIRPFKSLAMDKHPKAGAHATKLATSLVPGSSLWYTSLAYQRLFADRVQAWADPDAHRAFSKKIHDEMRDYKRGFWWEPGSRAPRSGPRFGR